jgi:hypothetical protein
MAEQYTMKKTTAPTKAPQPPMTGTATGRTPTKPQMQRLPFENGLTPADRKSIRVSALRTRTLYFGGDPDS